MTIHELEKPRPHLKKADLDRVATPEEAESLHLICHEADCFIYDHELGASRTDRNPQTTEFDR